MGFQFSRCLRVCVYLGRAFFVVNDAHASGVTSKQGSDAGCRRSRRMTRLRPSQRTWKLRHNPMARELSCRRRDPLNFTIVSQRRAEERRGEQVWGRKREDAFGSVKFGGVCIGASKHLDFSGRRHSFYDLATLHYRRRGRAAYSPPWVTS